MKNLIDNNNSVIRDLLVHSLVNPENEMFIGAITIEQVEELMDTDTNKDGWVEVFWSAFSRAQAIYLKNKGGE